MFNVRNATSTIDFGTQDREGPLPRLLVLLTVVTGVVDAVSFLKLGSVFVANMTGNVVFAGFAIAGVEPFWSPASFIAIAAFLAGAIAGGRLRSFMGYHRGRHLAIATFIQTVLVAAAVVLAMRSLDPNDGTARYVLIVLLALAMSIQNTTALHLRVPNLTTTVLTLTIAGLAADSIFPGGTHSQTGRRLVSVGAMFLGAALGAILISRSGVSAALALALALLVFVCIGAHRQWSSSANWTKEAN
jgi:uncharacterized membrane protein YoaK (UPF0700 family)